MCSDDECEDFESNIKKSLKILLKKRRLHFQFSYQLHYIILPYGIFISSASLLKRWKTAEMEKFLEGHQHSFAFHSFILHISPELTIAIKDSPEEKVPSVYIRNRLG